ncbi:hypothetical protein M0R04_05780 [Candidatus Dojkabacteria bacterium]|jgi:hypothetical protein|nr:hypothetical protein [Candidatus Dojkabacteria bacterium]
MSSEEKKDNKISPETYELIAKQLEATTQELERYRQKSPLVGVVWYGDGGFSIGLESPILGITKVILRSYGEKAVITHSAWLRIQGTNECIGGIIVRDDSAINALGAVGVVAKKDSVSNPNAFTDEQILEILGKSSLNEVKSIVSKMTNHFAPRHFLRVAKANGIEASPKLSIVVRKYQELFTQHKYSILHHHDLTTACELAGIQFEGLSKKEMEDELVKLELSNNDRDLIEGV